MGLFVVVILALTLHFVVKSFKKEDGGGEGNAAAAVGTPAPPLCQLNGYVAGFFVPEGSVTPYGNPEDAETCRKRCRK